MFIDETTIHVKSGDGGNGAVAFLRLKFMPWGGPSGGDGGRGGDVIFKATNNVDTLLPLYRRRRIAAQGGQNGSGKKLFGAFGKRRAHSSPARNADQRRKRESALRSGRG